MRGAVVGLKEKWPNRVVSPAAAGLQRTIPSNIDSTIIDKFFDFIVFLTSGALLDFG
jgi:hypothetical protein